MPSHKDGALSAADLIDGGSPGGHSLVPSDIVATGNQAGTAKAVAAAPFQPAVVEPSRPLDMETQVTHEIWFTLYDDDPGISDGL